MRWRVLRRRYVSPLEAVALLVVSGLAWLLGQELGEQLARGIEPLGAGMTLVLLAFAAAGTRLAGRLLYGSRELVLLISHGLPPRALVRLRALELCVLFLVVLVPLGTCLAGAMVSQGLTVSMALVGVAVLLAPSLACMALAGAWVASRLGRRVTAAGTITLCLGLIGVWIHDPAGFVAIVGHPSGPGGVVLEAASGGSLLALPALAGFLVLAYPLLERLIPLRFGESLDQGSRRSGRTSLGSWRLLGRLLRPLGGQAAALLQRDLTLLLRGGFLRGAIILAALPATLGIVFVVLQDKKLQPWHMQLMGLLLTGIIASASGFLFGVDFPRARRGCLLLERTQPLRGRAVLVSRWAPAAAYALLLVGGIAWVMTTSDRSALARRAWSFLPGGLLMALIVSHHAVAYGMRSETKLDPAEAAAYPMNGGVLIILFGIALLIHPLSALAYPLLWFGFARDAMRRWETAEVEATHEAAA